MKKINFLLCSLALVVVVSCDSKTTEPEQVTIVEEETVVENEPATEETLCEVTDYQVFDLTADLWKQAWETVLSLELGTTTPLSDDQLYRDFEFSTVQAFLADPTYPDVRIYFAKENPSDPNTTGVPDLLMVHANGCSDDITQNGLLATSTATTSCTPANGETYITNWKNHRSNAVEFDHKIAYTFKKQTLLDVLNNGQNGLVEFLRFYNAVHVSDVWDTQQTTQGYLVLDLVAGSAPDGAPVSGSYSDFTRPCPELCDDASPYFLAAQ